MNFIRLSILIFTVFTIGFLSCSSEPCEDLKEKAESCTDNEVKALLLKVAKDGDKQECTDFLNSFYHTFGSRCISEIKDATTVSDAESD